MSQLIIRRIRIAHCKLGPERCETCRKMDADRICLLDIAPEDAGLIQRRVIEIQIAGESAWREYDVVRSFENEDEARRFALSKQIDDVVI